MNLSAAFIPIVPTGKPQVGQYWCSVAQLDPQWGQILETDCWLVTNRGSRKVILSGARRHDSRDNDALGPKHHPKRSKRLEFWPCGRSKCCSLLVQHVRPRPLGGPF